MAATTKLTLNEEGKPMENTKYHGMIRSLIFSVCVCARYQEKPKSLFMKPLNVFLDISKAQLT